MNWYEERSRLSTLIVFVCVSFVALGIVGCNQPGGCDGGSCPVGVSGSQSPRPLDTVMAVYDMQGHATFFVRAYKGHLWLIETKRQVKNLPAIGDLPAIGEPPVHIGETDSPAITPNGIQIIGDKPPPLGSKPPT